MDTVFYSWQADLPANTNRSLILEALKKACETVSKTRRAAPGPVVDRDTEGVPGAPNITATILAKIRSAAVFVADVSLINPKRSEDCRATPNPNVLVELGFAIAHLGHERVILVFNGTTGKVEELPFDLRQHRVLRYEATSGEEKAVVRRQLQASLETAIQTIFESMPIPPQAKTAPSLDGSRAENLIAHVRELIKSDDRIGWRQLNQHRRTLVTSSAMAWRRKYEDQFHARPSVTRQELEAAMDDYLAPIQGVIASAVAGAEAGQRPFADSDSVVRDVLGPSGWTYGGTTHLVHAPRAAVYVVHHILGAASLVGDLPGHAARLATLAVRHRSERDPVPLVLQSDLTAYPETIGGNCRWAWEYLSSIPNRFPWISWYFGDVSQFQLAIASYNILLSIVELGLRIQDKVLLLRLASAAKSLRAEVVPLFCLSDESVRARALHAAVPDAQALEKIASSVGVKAADLREYWRTWMKDAVFPYLSDGRLSGGGFWHFDSFFPGSLP